MDYSKVNEDSSSLAPEFLSKGSKSFAIVTLAKATIGVGILALPKHALLGGIPLFITLLGIAGYLTARSMEMICKGAAASQKYGFEEISQSLLGSFMSYILGASIFVNCFGASIVYIVAIKGALATLLVKWISIFNFDIVLVSTCLVGLPLCACSLIEKLDSLSYLSFSGMIGVVVIVLSVVYVAFLWGVSETLSEPPAISAIDSIIWPTGGALEMMNLVSTLIFALTNQPNVPQIYLELNDRQPSNIRTAAILSAVIPIAIYILTACSGYLCFGTDVKENILTNFAPLVEANNVVVVLGIIAVILSVSCCHVLNAFPMRTSVLFFLPDHVKDYTVVKYGVPLILSILSVVIALAYSELSVYLGLLGASTGGLICFIFPALFSIKADIVQAGKNATTLRMILSHPLEFFMLLIGVIVAVVGTCCELASFAAHRSEKE